MLIYYGLIYAVFGPNPVAAAFVNSLTSLFAALLLADLVVQLKIVPSRYSWLVGLGLLIPEMIWFDALTGKEPIVGWLFVLGIYSFYSLQRSALGSRERKKWLIALCVTAIALAAVRPAMMVGLLLCSLIISFLSGKMRLSLTRGRIALLLIIAALAPLVPWIVKVTSGQTDFTYVYFLKNMLTSPDKEMRYGFEGDSIASRFQPHNYLELMWMTPLKLGLFMLVPYPKWRSDLTGVWLGQWGDWWRLSSDLSIFPYLLFLPFVFVSSLTAWRDGSYRKRVVWFLVPWWLLMLMPALATYGLHARFRVPAALFFVPCVLAGLGRRRYTLLFLGWYALLLLVAVVYQMIKI